MRVPTLVIWGRYDAWIPVSHADRFAHDIAGAQVKILEAGHMPQEERPAETAALIAGFLQPQGGNATDDSGTGRLPP